MFLLFDILYVLACLVYAPLLVLRGKWHRGLLLRFGGALGGIDYSGERRKNVWVHAVSVGEVNAVTPLVEKLLQSAKMNVYLTVSTATGHELAQKKWKGKLMVLWAPLDFSWVVRRYIQKLRPDVYVIAETEVWPNVIAALVAQRIPVAVINARISSRAYPRYAAMRWLLRPTFARLSHVAVQSDLDRKRFELLGGKPQNISVIGNLKFDQPVSLERARREDYKIAATDLLWVAGSTHPGEEELLFKVYAKLTQEFPSLRFIIAPRHIERSDELKKTIHSLGLANVVVIDKIGQLRSVYDLADVVFVGKSLLPPGGGQNIIEPAILGKPTIVGAYTQNFTDVMEQFASAKAIIVVQDQEELKAALEKLLQDPQARSALGAKAKAVVQKHQGVTEKTFKIIENLLNGA